jgi:transcriptional regulator with XRE-family HTH domain
MGNIIDTLKKLISERGISHARIERECGVNRISIGRFMSGKTSLSLDQAERLAEYFGLELTPKADPPQGGK